MWLNLIRFFYSETPGSKAAILTASTASGLCRGMLLVTINAAVAAWAEGGPEPFHVFAFFAFLACFLGMTYHAMSRAKISVETLTQRLRLRICDKLLFNELDFVEARGTGALYARLTQDINRLSSSAITLMRAFQALVVLVFCMIYIGWLTIIGLAVALITVGLGVGTYFVQRHSIRRDLFEVREREAEFFEAMGDLLKGFKEIKISRAKHVDIDNWITHISDSYRKLNVSVELKFIRSQLTTETFQFALIAALIFVLPYTVATGTTTIFQFLAAILFLIGPLEALVGSIPTMMRASVCLENVQELERSLDAAIPEDENRARQVEPLTFDTIRLEGVRFRFTGHESDDQFDLGPIDLEVRRGEVLFIAGGNGAGKTTLLKLLTGLYRPSAGRILVDGRAITGAEYQAHREMFTTVFGDFHLFRRLFGIAEVDLDTLDRLLALVQIDDKTHYENDRFSTIDLSAGQRKRLAYAICHLEDRQIYVFDEFAAELDPMFRRFYYESLLPELKRAGKTVVAVTHDDAYFDRCDRRVTMDYGRMKPADGPVRGVSLEALAEH